jgi:hypothetical protein
MKHLILCGALLISAGMVLQAQQDRRPYDDRVPNYTNDTQQLGYEHGYRDGADRGRQDRDRGVGRGLQPPDYRDGARYSYSQSYGNRRDYMDGYRQGFQTGYDDGYNYYERDGRYGQIYGRNGSRFSGPPDGSRSPAPRNFGSRFDQGYRDGVATGQDDQRRNTRSDYRSGTNYRNGDRDYQDGVDRGYQDGYGRSRYQSDGGGYFPNRGTSGPADTRDGVGPQTRTITVPSTNQWTPTGIRVNQGDHVQFQASGQIQLKPSDPKDVAIPAGSLLHRYAPNSPMPNVTAGALLGRIDSGQPWGLGGLTDVVMPGSGMLYLGINDDVLTDNSGEFTVKISW